MKPPMYIAIDLGAASGRVMSGTFTDQGLQLTEVHRFANGGVRLGDHLYWDILHQWDEVKNGLHQARNQFGETSFNSIGLDSWGIDYGLLDANDTLIQNPYHYRGPHANNMVEAVLEVIPAEEVYAQTGNQLIQINSLYQLYSMVRANSPVLSIAQTFLNIPDLFNFFLTGEKANEFSITSTSQCYNPIEKTWAYDLLSRLNIPAHIFGQVIPSGTVLGPLRSSLQTELRLETPVVAIAGHDTGSAVAAVPAEQEDYIYLSSGTWSLMGVELNTPMISPEILQANMTNEGGYGGITRFLQNIVGLWILQECRRLWAQFGEPFDFPTLNQMATASPAFGPQINPGDTRFLGPLNMIEEIQSYCQETKQQVPTEKGAIIRCILESLAMEYRWVAEQIDRLTGKHHPVIYIIGGGSKNDLLNQFTANATGRTVMAGLEEATTIGNILVQAIATGQIASLAEGRQIVRQSFPMRSFEPQETDAWDAAYQRYKTLKA